MAKLYFRYGTVGSAKTLNLLAVAHNYRQQGKKVLLVKPALDTRFGKNVIKTRAGLEVNADVLAPENGPITRMPALSGIDCVLVDEAQFLHPAAIDQLRHITYTAVAPTALSGIPVICYGLRTDFRQQLFPASSRLFELADSIEEIKTTCAFCTKKAVFNLKLRDGQPTLEGPPVTLGCEEIYLPACGACYAQQHNFSCAQPSRTVPAL